MGNSVVRVLTAVATLAIAASAAGQSEESLFHAEPFTAVGSFTEEIEGPACDAEGNIFAVSFRRKPTIGRITPEGRGSVFLELTDGSLGNGIRFDRDGMMYVADHTGHNVLRVDPRTKELTVFAHESRMNQPNDLAITADGTLYASDPNWDEDTGQVWRIGRDGSMSLVAENMNATNGIEVSPDGRTLYVNETEQRKIWAFRIEPDGSLTGKRLLHEFPDHGLDGMRCDVDGDLYVTRWGKGTVVKLSPDGKLLREIDVLGANPTNVCFGGPDGRTCYVSEMERGRLVTFRTDRPGLAWQRWQKPKAGGLQYELLLKGGHVIDPKNAIDGAFDVAVTGGRIARIDRSIPKSSADKTIQIDGLYVTPGLIDMHTHNYAGTGLRALTGDQSLYPDPFSFRTGVTTMVDAGTAGWRNFPDFRQRIIDRATTRVLAFLNISGVGMAPEGENDPSDMDPQAAVRMARDHEDIIVGFKVAHFEEESWLDLDNALAAGRATELPIMVDFGYTGGERNLDGLLRDKLRKGDIYTHCYSGHRDELLESGKLNPAMIAGRRRGILFDLGHGGGSFYWNIAVPAFQQGFLPDTISTDLHIGSMNTGMKDVPNVMSKVLNLGVPLADVVRMTTWSAATSINRPELGHLSVGAGADITVMRLEKGEFGFVDAAGARRPGTQRLAVELTIRDGRVVWDLNGRASGDWETFPYKKRERPKPRVPAAPK